MTWTLLKNKKPSCKRGEEATSLLVYPYVDVVTNEVRVQQVYYGRRQTGRPEFYLYGAVLHDVTHWMPMPDPPPRST